jgi:DNA-binding transcriptional MerR regulator
MATSETNWWSPSEMAERTGTTIDTLRYYEKKRLITGVARADSGHRRYSEADVGWFDVLRCLRLTGMPIPQMKQFAELGQQGEDTEPDRYAQLIEHRARVVDQIAELRVCVAPPTPHADDICVACFRVLPPGVSRC